MNILLISGHGAGDPGAVSTINGVRYEEATETRKVTAALKKALEGYCNVTIYDPSHNAYSDYKNGRLNSLAYFPNYNYVLEIHFNAFQAGSSDGKTKGVECYVTNSESGTGVEERICKNISSVTGLTNRGVKRYNWSVIYAAKRAGVSSALLEVCFIDDPDDMALYTKKFQEIINAIAKGIADGFGFKMELTDEKNEQEEEEMTIYKKLEDVPSWGKATIKKLINKGYLAGENGGLLNIEENMLRVLVINDRAGLYG